MPVDINRPACPATLYLKAAAGADKKCYVEFQIIHDGEPKASILMRPFPALKIALYAAQLALRGLLFWS